MTTRLIAIATILLFALPLAAEEPAPFPEYPAYRPGSMPAADKKIYSLVSFDLLEVAPFGAEMPGEVEGFWRLGTAYNSFWLKFDGGGLIGDATGGVELQALYSRILTSFFDVQAGLRLDTEFGDNFRARPQLVVGFEGLAPFLFKVEPALFVSFEGHISARLEGHYDLYITQRLIVQPEAELNVAVQEVEDWGIGSGLNDIGLGARLRYEIVREFAPYIGINWTRRFGESAEFARADGESASEVHFVAGARIWW